MGTGSAELMLIGVILGVTGYALVVPIVGIVRAVRRKNRNERSTGAVIWSAINVGLFALVGVLGIADDIPVLGPRLGLALNVVWLALAVQANRAAARGRPPVA